MWYRDNIYGINAKSLMLQFGKNAWAWNVYSSDTNSINDFNIHHVAVTVSSANTNNPTVSFYIDGVLKNTTWWGSSTKAAINYASDVSSVRVAHVFSPSNTSYYNINGSLNVYNLQVYKRTLSAAEILQNYNAHSLPVGTITSSLVLNYDAGNILSYPGTGTIWKNMAASTTNNGVLTNGPTYSSTNSGSIVFDGTNDYVSGGTANMGLDLSDKTFQCWIRTNGLGNYGIIDKDFDTGPGVYGGWGYYRIRRIQLYF